MITFGSRYMLSNLVLITSSDGQQVFPTVLDREHFAVEDLEHGWTYRAPQMGFVEDWWDPDMLAFDITGREGMWFLLADVNDVLDPFDPVSRSESKVVPSKESFDAVFRQLSR